MGEFLIFSAFSHHYLNYNYKILSTTTVGVVLSSEDFEPEPEDQEDAHADCEDGSDDASPEAAPAGDHFLLGLAGVLLVGLGRGSQTLGLDEADLEELVTLVEEVHVLDHLLLGLHELLEHLVGLVPVLGVLVPLGDQLGDLALVALEVVSGLLLLNLFDVGAGLEVVVVSRLGHEGLLEPVQEVHGFVESHVGCLADGHDRPGALVPVVHLVLLVEVEGLARVGREGLLMLKDQLLEIGLDRLVVAVEDDLVVPVDDAGVDDRHYLLLLLN